MVGGPKAFWEDQQIDDLKNVVEVKIVQVFAFCDWRTKADFKNQDYSLGRDANNQNANLRWFFP